MSSPTQHPPEPHRPQHTGFQTGGRRFILELGALLLVALLAGWAAWQGVRWLGIKLAENLPPDAERSLGRTAWMQLAPTSSRCTNQAVLDYVDAVMRPLTAQQPPGFAFEITVVEDPSLNAYALPGGFITVNSGLLQRIERSEELAGVLAHEIAHVTLRHGTRRVLTQLGTFAVLGWLFGGTDIHASAQLLAGLVSTAYAREQEAEADTEGLRVLVAAHIDPKGMAELFERIAEEQPKLPELLSTHPDPGARAERARAIQPSAGPSPLPALPEARECR